MAGGTAGGYILAARHAEQETRLFQKDRVLISDDENAGVRNAMEEATYVCDSCGEEIVIPVDVSGGMEQTFVEDCPVCCGPNEIHVSITEGGEIECSATPA